MFVRKSSFSHMLTMLLPFSSGEVVGKQMFNRLELSLNSNTEALEDKLSKNTKSINRYFKRLGDIIQFLKGRAYSMEEHREVKVRIKRNHIC